MQMATQGRRLGVHIVLGRVLTCLGVLDVRYLDICGTGFSKLALAKRFGNGCVVASGSVQIWLVNPHLVWCCVILFLSCHPLCPNASSALLFGYFWEQRLSPTFEFAFPPSLFPRPTYLSKSECISGSTDVQLSAENSLSWKVYTVDTCCELVETLVPEPRGRAAHTCSVQDCKVIVRPTCLPLLVHGKSWGRSPQPSVVP